MQSIMHLEVVMYTVLDWFMNSGLEFKYSVSAIDYASENGHVSVFDWFKNSRF